MEQFIMENNMKYTEVIVIGINEYTIKEIPQEEINRLVQEADQRDLENAYEICMYNRRLNYPPMADYLDGLVKGDQAQIDEYVRKCLEVKAKYPKPE